VHQCQAPLIWIIGQAHPAGLVRSTFDKPWPVAYFRQST
jgi:hypothetical protein